MTVAHVSFKAQNVEEEEEQRVRRLPRAFGAELCAIEKKVQQPLEDPHLFF